MRRIIVTLLLVSCFASGFAQNNVWLSSFEDAQKLSIATNRLIFIDFYASWCGPCKEMDREAFTDPTIKEILKKYVLLRLDFDKEVSLRNKYGIKAIPYILITDSHGKVIDKERGYSGKNSVASFLSNYKLNISFLQRESTQYYHNKNYATAMRLAQKYLDFSLFVEQKIKLDFIKLAQIYLDASEDLLDKKQSNYALMSQKLELFKLTSALYAEKYRKLERGLEKIDDTKIEKLNKDLYSFLNYCLAFNQQDVKAQEKWESKILASSSSEIYLKRKKQLFGL